MVEFVLTPPFLIPVAIAAVLGAAMMKTPEKAPDSYSPDRRHSKSDL